MVDLAIAFTLGALLVGAVATITVLVVLRLGLIRNLESEAGLRSNLTALGRDVEEMKSAVASLMIHAQRQAATGDHEPMDFPRNREVVGTPEGLES